MRKTLQELGIHDYFYYDRGKSNNITDVPGVKVGHSTLVAGENVRTGVSVVIPPDSPNKKYIAGGFCFNTNGEVTGLHYIFEEARLTSPIFLTNTLSVGDVFSAIVDQYNGTVALPIIGECWDGFLNDIEGRHVTHTHVSQAIQNARSGEIEQGSVGAGTGMTSFGFKAGIGTASRKLTLLDEEYTVGILVNNNMGRDDNPHKYLRIGGVDVSKLLKNNPIQSDQIQSETHVSSSILIIATDIPLTHDQLNRISRHAPLAMGRIGLISYSGSGDFVLAFSTGNEVNKREEKTMQTLHAISNNLLDEVFEATLEAIEEAYLNSLLTAETTVGRDGHVAEALPIDSLLPFIRQ